MIVAVKPTLTNEEMALCKRWFLDILRDPGFNHNEFPTKLTSIIYIDDIPHHCMHGHWELTRGILYLARASGNVADIDKLSIISTLAAIHGFGTIPEIREALCSAFIRIIQTLTTTVYSSCVVASERPTRIAVNLAMNMVAMELDNRWTLAGGAPIEVIGDSWIIMNF